MRTDSLFRFGYESWKIVLCKSCTPRDYLDKDLVRTTGRSHSMRFPYYLYKVLHRRLKKPE
jgi:hypothetical protein